MNFRVLNMLGLSDQVKTFERRTSIKILEKNVLVTI